MKGNAQIGFELRGTNSPGAHPMQRIEAILFEPVGCLAEFPAAPFDEIAARFFDPRKLARRQSRSQSGSRSYWHLLNLMEEAGPLQIEANRAAIEALEVQAAAAAAIYEDVVPALSELRTMGVRLLLASSLSGTAFPASGIVTPPMASRPYPSRGRSLPLPCRLNEPCFSPIPPRR